MGENEYQSREFCRDTACLYQMEIDYLREVDDRQFVIREGDIREIKDEHCQHCKAYQFHQWLKEKNYKIVKGE